MLLVGILSLFADFTYEAARSINGQFLALLGASATVVGFTGGFGELVGYGLRSASGFFADRTGKYWLTAIIGYTINLFAVPALAFAGNWPLAATLVIVERAGRAMRKPPTEAMLSHAGSQLGQGWVFGFKEALDQLGAALGPIVMALVLLMRGSYKTGYSLLTISAVLALITLLVARYLYPRPHDLEKPTENPGTPDFGRVYWWYMLAGACVAAGFADFALIGYHFQKTGVVSRDLIPIYYAVAMGMGSIGALVFGKLFDKNAGKTILGAFLLSTLFAPFIFLGNSLAAFFGMVLWGLGLSAQESLLKPLVAHVIVATKRATAFGLFDTGFGIAWFLGSWLMGYLYSRSTHELVIFSVTIQLLALPIFWMTYRKSGVK